MNQGAIVTSISSAPRIDPAIVLRAGTSSGVQSGAVSVSAPAAPPEAHVTRTGVLAVGPPRRRNAFHEAWGAGLGAWAVGRRSKTTRSLVQRNAVGPSISSPYTPQVATGSVCTPAIARPVAHASSFCRIHALTSSGTTAHPSAA